MTLNSHINARLSLDSLDVIELISALENKYKIEIQNYLFDKKIDTIEDLINMVMFYINVRDNKIKEIPDIDINEFTKIATEQLAIFVEEYNSNKGFPNIFPTSQKLEGWIESYQYFLTGQKMKIIENRNSFKNEEN